MSHVCTRPVTHGNLTTECCATTERSIRSKAMPTGCKHAKASSNHRSSVPNSHSRCVCFVRETVCEKDVVHALPHSLQPYACVLLTHGCLPFILWTTFSCVKKVERDSQGHQISFEIIFPHTTSEFCFQARAPTPNFAQDWAKCYVFPQFFLGAHKSVCFCPQIWAYTLLHASEFNLNTWPHAISRSRTRFPDPAWDQKQLCLYTNNPTQESCAVVHKFASRLSHKHNICSFFLFGVVNELTFFWSALRCCPSSTSRSQTLARMTMYSSFCTTDPTDRFLSVCLWWFPSRGR